MNTLSRLRSGALIDLASPDPAHVDLDHVGLVLAGLPRFNAQSPSFLSVAEHALAVARDVRADMELPALLHDAHEAFLGDQTRPARAAIAAEMDQVGFLFTEALERVERRLDAAVAWRVLFEAGVALDALPAATAQLAGDMRGPVVKRADDAACDRELAALWHAPATPRNAGHDARIAARWVADVRRAALAWVAWMKGEGA